MERWCGANAGGRVVSGMGTPTPIFREKEQQGSFAAPRRLTEVRREVSAIGAN
jgi:hypothetical protein